MFLLCARAFKVPKDEADGVKMDFEESNMKSRNKVGVKRLLVLQKHSWQDDTF